MSLSVSGISPALSLMIVHNLNAAQDRVNDDAAHLAANTRVLTAADDPSAIGRIAWLTSAIGENNVLLGQNSIARGTLAGYTADLATVQTALDGGDPATVAAAVHGLTSTVNTPAGTVPAWTGAQTVTDAGRSYTLPDLRSYADAISAALAGGDTATATATMTSLATVVSDAQGSLAGTDLLLQGDVATRGATNTTLTAELDDLTALDVPTTQARLAGDQLLVTTNAWLAQQLAQNATDTVRTLLGIRS